MGCDNADMNKIPRIFTKTRRNALSMRLIVACLGLAGLSCPTLAQAPVAAVDASAGVDDAVILDMAQAWRKKDKASLAALLPQASGHVLEPWGAYWELAARLPTAVSDEVDAYLQRYAGTYQEDRLRNDWLLQLGQSGDMAAFARYYPAYRMRDDGDVHCYAAQAAPELGLSDAQALALMREGWRVRRDSSAACTQAAGALLARRVLDGAEVWRKARQVAESTRPAAIRATAAVVAVADADSAASVPAVLADPAAWLAANISNSNSNSNSELALLALARLSASNPDRAAELLQSGWAQRLGSAQRDWAWGVVGKQAALNLDAAAMRYYAQVGQLQNLPQDQVEWLARAAMRAGDWAQVQRAIQTLPASVQAEPVWSYWLARSLQGGQRQAAQRPEAASQLLSSIAGNYGFYEQLAQEELQGSIGLPPVPEALTSQEQAQARANAGLQRALYAKALGLTAEANREWNYTTSLYQPGGMSDRELLAAAAIACQQQWWDRCINTSERTKATIDMQQRFPMPYRDAITSASAQAGLDAAWVYGLIRQESRFVASARSGAGAAGLMQVMPGTARLVARKLGMAGVPAGVEGNVQLGTAYLAMLYQEFDGSAALASAGYNAGPGRPRRWRNGADIEGAIWAENIPFNETRDYVKKVLANSVNYALLLERGRAQSLYTRLGQVAPLVSSSAAAEEASPSAPDNNNEREGE